MKNNKTKLIIAPKREFREQTPADWQSQISELEGVKIIGQQPMVMQVEATRKALVEIEDLFKSKFHIEQEIIHHKAK